MVLTAILIGKMNYRFITFLLICFVSFLMTAFFAVWFYPQERQMGADLIEAIKPVKIPEKYKLKVDKDKIIENYEVEVFDETGSSTGKVMKYKYLDTNEKEAQKLNGKNEVLSLRNEGYEVYKTDEDGKYQIKIYSEPKHKKVDGKWYSIIEQETDIEAFKKQTKPDLISRLFKMVKADETTADTTYNNGDINILSNEPTTNRDGATFNPRSHSALTWRSLISFDIPSDPGSGNTITDVEISIYNYSVQNGSDDNISAHELSRSNWVEGEATWNVYSTGNSWTTAGGDYSAIKIDTVDSVTTGVYHTWTLMGSGATNPLTLDWEDRFDLLFKFDDESPSSNSNRGWCPKEDSASASCNTNTDPYLTITYEAGGEPPASNPCQPTPGQPFFQSQDCFITSDVFHNERWIVDGVKLIPDGGSVIIDY